MSDICFGVQSLQAVSVDFENPFDFAEQCPFWCPISTDSECELYWLCFQPHFLFLTISAGGMWHALLLFTALHIIMSVSH